MPKSTLAKYVRKTTSKKKGVHPEIKYPGLILKSDKTFGNREFQINFTPVSKPFLMVEENHTHDFDQFLFFTGGDTSNLPDLGGVVELTLSKDGKKMEKFTFRESTCVFIPAGLYHCPLHFKKIDNPKKPILFSNLFFTKKYKKIANPSKKKTK